MSPLHVAAATFGSNTLSHLASPHIVHSPHDRKKLHSQGLVQVWLSNGEARGVEQEANSKFSYSNLTSTQHHHELRWL